MIPYLTETGASWLPSVVTILVSLIAPILAAVLTAVLLARNDRMIRKHERIMNNIEKSVEIYLRNVNTGKSLVNQEVKIRLMENNFLNSSKNLNEIELAKLDKMQKQISSLSSKREMELKNLNNSGIEITMLVMHLKGLSSNIPSKIKKSYGEIMKCLERITEARANEEIKQIQAEYLERHSLYMVEIIQELADLKSVENWSETTWSQDCKKSILKILKFLERKINECTGHPR